MTRRPEVPSRPTLAGNFVELDCRNQPPRMIIETTAGRKTFLLADPGKVIITAGSEGPVDMACGIQKKPAKVEIGYDPPPDNASGLQGVVKTLAF